MNIRLIAGSFLLTGILTLSACSEEKAHYEAAAPQATARGNSSPQENTQSDAAQPASPVSEEGNHAETAKRLLAYSYTYHVELENEALIPVWKQHQQACVSPECELISSTGQESTEQQPASAQLKLRLVPTQLKKFEASLTANNGKIVQRYVNSEDKTEVVRDITHRLQIQNDLRDRYRALLGQTRNINELLSIEKELSRTQKEIEELTAKQTQVRREVDKVLIEVHYESRLSFNQGTFSPVKRAFYDMGRNFADGLAGAITFIAIALPWAVIVLPLIFVLVLLKRKFLNRKKSDTLEKK